MKRKLIFFIIGGILFISLLGGSIYFYFYHCKVEVILKEDLTVSYQEDVTLDTFINSIQNGEILDKNIEIDTSTIGKKQIIVELKNKLGRREFYTFEIQVVDVVPPLLTCQDSISVTVGEKTDLLKGVSVTDDVDQEISVSIEGEYDLEKPGVYSLYYVAKDSSGNETRKPFQLRVVAKKVVNGSSNHSGVSNQTSTFTTSKGFKGVVQNGATYIDGVLIANKTYSLPSTYGNGLTRETETAFNQMKLSAQADGIHLTVVSSFRSYASQKSIYNNYVSRDGREKADRYSARAGHSEHQTGLALDINSLSTDFEYTKEGKWLSAHASEFGFILRYPKNKESITGYMYEPWHFRYVGIDLAKKLYNNGDWMTLEEYFGITSQYQ